MLAEIAIWCLDLYCQASVPFRFLDPLCFCHVQRYHSYIRRGIYKPQIERFKRVYGENLVVVKSEDMFNDAKRVVNKIFDRAGLKGIDLRKEKVHKEGSYDKKIEIKDDLETFFSPYNEELYDLLETEKWWRY
ncbi:hypothetical protein [Salinibacter ruber]|uniref:Uncharacterized protein n=2 Tax=Salinibacter ruber TaxID=146919 RepID=A0A9X3A077_9BACT|nr:hypothetical protein [Salinibacter ruber]MCS3616972.1 hypothetical protein [Salinibacter ruber]MCS3675834.1 hypothetical protein [Salinibacter ruber]MCS4037948.1 hypothetical protein [Salinibacter ruber]